MGFASALGCLRVFGIKTPKLVGFVNDWFLVGGFIGCTFTTPNNLINSF
jgi:hypothetical protein